MTNNFVNALVVSGTNLFAGTFNGGIFRSSNNGTSWTAVNTGLTNARVYSLAVSGTNLFAGTAGGVFLSTNNGTSWSAASTGLPNSTVYALVASDTSLFAGTGGGGVWRRPLSEMITSVKTASMNLPKHLTLGQNYPNPFNPATTITFGLPSKSFVSLKVFDVLGREVSVLLSEELSAGTYSRRWNARGLASGVYFYRLQAGDYVETKKLMLLR